MRNHRRLSFLFPLLLTAILSAQGPSASWKQNNDRQNRYEGVGFERPVGTPGVELVGVVDEGSAFATDTTAPLSVDFFATEPTHAVVIARELVLSAYYWMESKPSSVKAGTNTFAPWTTEVLRQHSTLTPQNLGVLVYLGPNGSKDLVAPAIVRSGGDIRRSARYQVTFLPETVLSRVSYRITEGCSDPGKELKAGKLGRQYAQIPFGITVDLSRQPTGKLRLRLDYVRDDGAAYFEVCMLHVSGGRSGSFSPQL